MQVVHFLVKRAFHCVNSMISLGVHCLLFLHNVAHHLAQVHNSLFNGGGCGWDEDPCYCCVAGGIYGGGFGFQERFGWFLQLGL